MLHPTASPPAGRRFRRGLRGAHPAGRRAAGWFAAAWLACAALPCGATAPAPPFIYGPYQYLPLSGRADVAPMARAGVPAPTLTLAFATGDCGAERWGTRDGQAVARQELARLEAAGVHYVISTGGQGGQFDCRDARGMQAFLARYDGPGMVGLDFDIEAGQDPDHIQALVGSLAGLAAQHPGLRLSFTLPTLAASDGSGAGLNAQGARVMEALAQANLQDYVVNLMVMDYGPPGANSCVPRAAACDMAASALQAAHNLMDRYALPAARIELTPMIGANDTPGSVFTLADAQALAHAVRAQGFGGLHWWSLDRDQPCPSGTTGVSERCHGLEDAPAGSFLHAFQQGAR